MNYTDQALSELAGRFQNETHWFSAPVVVLVNSLVEDLRETRGQNAENAVALEKVREDLQDMAKRVDHAQAVLLRLARDLRDARGMTPPLVPTAPSLPSTP
jgi:hypothetical protein